MYLDLEHFLMAIIITMIITTITSSMKNPPPAAAIMYIVLLLSLLLPSDPLPSNPLLPKHDTHNKDKINRESMIITVLK